MDDLQWLETYQRNAAAPECESPQQRVADAREYCRTMMPRLELSDAELASIHCPLAVQRRKPVNVYASLYAVDGEK